jgi:hypothetical protein
LRTPTHILLPLPTGALTARIMCGILARGGWSIIRVGCEDIILSGTSMEIGVRTIIGTIATGGGITTSDGLVSIILTGTENSSPAVRRGCWAVFD